jgi:hypothetical protein
VRGGVLNGPPPAPGVPTACDDLSRRVLTLSGAGTVLFFTYMTVILLESALFIALLAVVGALFATALGFTPFGRRIRQTANRKRIDRQADLTCPIHGLQREEDLVRLPTGEPLCSHCYKEAVHGHID